ncbi:MAG: PP0621 family protein [Gammaproteobacteria bacterium]|nr:PP0621 family protein [Gammaproteobacteria bacterium]
MFRNLILLIAIAAAVWLISRMIKNKALQSSSKPVQKNEIKNIVQCHVCKVFIPEDKSVKQDQYSFCSHEHLQQWQEEQ